MSFILIVAVFIVQGSAGLLWLDLILFVWTYLLTPPYSFLQWYYIYNDGSIVEYSHTVKSRLNKCVFTVSVRFRTTVKNITML